MNEKQTDISSVLLNSINGKNAHVNPLTALEGLIIDIAGAKGLNTPHTIWQLLKHINYWQDKFINLIDNSTWEMPKTAAEGWDENPAPGNPADLQNEIKIFEQSLLKIEQYLKENPPLLNEPKEKYKSGYEVIQAMASHISYHIGEIVFLRKTLGSWPPPSGGDTW